MEHLVLLHQLRNFGRLLTGRFDRGAHGSEPNDGFGRIFETPPVARQIDMRAQGLLGRCASRDEKSDRKRAAGLMEDFQNRIPIERLS